MNSTSLVHQRTWDALLEGSWDRAPCVLPDALSEPLLHESELMPVLRRAWDVLMAGLLDPCNQARRPTSRIRLVVDGRVAHAPDYASFKPGDEEPAQWARQTTARLAGRPFGVVIGNLQLVYPRLWQRLQATLKPLITRVGVPAGELECSIFMGTYAHTPFGIHHDPGNAVITFAVVGRKRMLLWPPGMFAPDAMQSIEQHPQLMDSALALEIGPGDLLYWPPNWFHTHHQRGHAFHAAISIGFWHNAAPTEAVLAAARSELEAQGSEIDRPAGSWPLDPSLPGPLSAAIDRLEAVVRSGALRRRLERQWADRVSALGFNSAPDGELPWYCQD